MRLNIYAREDVQANILGHAIMKMNETTKWFFHKNGMLTHEDGTPWTVDALAGVLRVSVSPGSEKSLDDEKDPGGWQEVSAIPRPPLRTILENPGLVTSLGVPAAPGKTGTDGWMHVDLSTIDKTPATPTVLFREDGKPLLYQGKVNTVFGDSESGKSWICLLACVQELREGGSVAYLDYEDDAASVSGRLITMGVPEKVINDPERFLYFKLHKGLTDEALDWYANPHTWEVTEGVYKSRTGFMSCSLVVIDAMTEALSADGLSSNSDVDVAGWFNSFARRIAALGPAVVVIDHMNLSDKARVTGSQMKKSAVEGTSIRVMKGKSFDLAHGGHSDLFVAKDRNAAVRAVALGEKQYLGRFLVPDPIGVDGGMRDARITEPVEGPSEEEEAAATDVLMNLIADEMTAEGVGLSVRLFTKRFREAGYRADDSVIREFVRTHKETRGVA